MRLIPFHSVFTFALALGLAAGAAAQPAGLVQPHGRQFKLNGQPYRFVGVNIRGISSYGRGAPLIYTSSGDVDTNLNGLQAMNAKVIRLFAANKNHTTQENIDALQAVLDKMQARGQKAIVCLTDLYTTDFHPAGDDVYYMAQPGGWTLLDDTWFASGYTVNYLPWVQAAVTALKNHEAIFAWELGNELTDIKTPNNILAFTSNTAAAIKAIDPWHMVTTGYISVDHTQVGVTNGIAMYSNSNIDFITVHSYNGEDPAQNWAVAARVEKPLVLEEYGWSEGNGDRVTNTQTQLNKWYDSRLVQGFMQWGYQAGSWDIGDGDNNVGMDRYAHSDYDALFALYKARADAFDASPGALASLAWPSGDNLALTAAAWSTSSNFNSSYTGDKAIDGVISAASKWTSSGAALPQWIALDLGEEKNLTGFVIRMANEAGEDVYYAIKSFQFQSGSSLTGPWTTQFTASNPAQYSSVRHVFDPPLTARYVRLNVTDAGVDAYVRLPEFEVYGFGLAAVTGWHLWDQ